MARKPTPREVYDRESRDLLRIVSLVRVDKLRSEEWKERAEKALLDANRILVEPVKPPDDKPGG